MHVHLVAPPTGWILDKLAWRIHELSSATIGDMPDPAADINYYFNWHVFTFYDKQPGIDLLYYTHLNKGEESLVLDTLGRADHSTVISTYAMERAINLGVPADKLTLTLQPIDADWQPRPIRLAMPCRWYPDGRRDEWMLMECARRGALDGFLLVAMGPEWERFLMDIAALGVHAASIPQTGDFIADYAEHHKHMQYIDYVIHTATNDTIGAIDALATGVPLIHRRGGYSLDFATEPGSAHWFDTVDELEAILRGIMQKHRAIGEKARARTWPAFVAELEALWGRLCA